MLKWDGHTHTQFCYHGSNAPLEEYVESAIALGFQRYTVTEHPPLPQGWVKDKALFDELGMPEAELQQYFDYVLAVKKRYAKQIEITVGLELDYLHGSVEYTNRLVEQWGHLLEDVIYSVHYLPGEDGNYCVDFTADDFKANLLSFYGSMDVLVDLYFDHVELAIQEAGKLPVRSRIGHINLIRKFQKQLPAMNEQQFNQRLEALLPLLKEYGVGVDVNVAGFRVASCEQEYVPQWFIKRCLELEIPVVYGSDAHKPEQVGLFWDWFEEGCSNTGL